MKKDLEKKTSCLPTCIFLTPQFPNTNRFNFVHVVFQLIGLNCFLAIEPVNGYLGELKIVCLKLVRPSKIRFTNDDIEGNKCFASLLHSSVVSANTFKLAALVFNNPITSESSIVYPAKCYTLTFTLKDRSKSHCIHHGS